MTSTPALPAASVVICAYTDKRWDDIVAAVESVTTQSVPAAETFVIVDHNPELLRRATEALTPRGVQVLANQYAQGLSGARNTALDTVSGEVIAFLDDDASARPGWLAGLLAHYADPSVIAVGGAAHPAWPSRRPAVLPSAEPADRDATGELDWVVGCTYTGQPTQTAEVRNLMGCNMSFRREVFDRVGGFTEDVGRIGTVPLGCEETELCIRARQDYWRRGEDARILFEPAAAVDHRVSADRLGWSYLRRRCWAEGLSKAAVSKLVGSDDALSTERSYVAKVLPAAVGRELKRSLRGRRDGLVGASAVVIALAWTTAGYARGRLPGATADVRLPAAAAAPSP